MKIKGLIKTAREIDVYNSFRMYLKRVHKINKSAQLARFLLDKFTNIKYPTSFVKIFHKELTVIDTTDPEQISLALKTDLSKTLVIVGSKSGSTIETAAQLELFKSEFEK